MTVTVYRGSQRFSSSETGRVTRHSFSFGSHYDPANLGFGPMLCHNDDVLGPGHGYGEHPHRDLEIVTWVLSGALVHTDTEGNHRLLRPGEVQVLSAGSGIRHSEVGDPTSGPTRFIQVWLTPDEWDAPPAYRSEVLDEGAEGLVQVVGGDGLAIGRRGASLSVARLVPGQEVTLPSSPRQHVFAATGDVVLEGIHLAAGDAVRLEEAGGCRAVAEKPGELLVWSFDH